MRDRPADCRYRLDHRMGANNRIDTNNRSNVNRSYANDRSRGDADDRRDIGAGHRRRREQKQYGRDDFSHGLVVTPMCAAVSSVYGSK